MPDQNQTDPNQNATPPTPVGTPPTDQSNIPSAFSPTADLPPLPPAFQSAETNGSAAAATPTSTDSTPGTDSSGSATPPSTPPVISTPKKKFAGGRIIATILGVLLLIGGLGAGILLTQQQQLIEQKAAGPQACPIAGYNNCKDTSEPGACGSDPRTKCEGDKFCEAYRKESKCSANSDSYTAPFKWCCDGTDYVCKKVPGKCGIPPSPTPHVTATCDNLKAYSDSWSLLTSSQLTSLTPNTVVHFCIAGTASSGSFDKAQFTIKGNQLSETTSTRPGTTNEFCQAYTIKTTDIDTTVDVTAKIHHSSLGWQ